jgi:hypothetical protein
MDFMKRVIIISLTCCILGSCMLHAYEDDMDIRVVESLKHAGINLDDKSLIETLRSKDKHFARLAALALRSHKPSPQIIDALINAASDKDEVLAYGSMNTLHILGDASWRDLARIRLYRLNDKLVQVLIAQLLSRAGDGSGWDIIEDALNDKLLCTTALESIDEFDGKKKLNGEIMVVKNELRKIALRVPEESKKKIMDKLAK